MLSVDSVKYDAVKYETFQHRPEDQTLHEVFRQYTAGETMEGNERCVQCVRVVSLQLCRA